MLTAAIEKLLNLAKPESIEIEGRSFYDPSYRELSAEQDVNSFTVNTLTGLVDYVKSEFDTERKMMIHVESPTKIRLFDALNTTNDRRTYLRAEALLPEIHFGNWVEREMFQIALQANFCLNDDKAELLKVVSHMTVGEGATVKDSGVTQEVTVKQGIELAHVDLKERYTLMPYRTFVEVDQPASEFIFRVKDDGQKKIYCSLHEADGGAWELNAMHSIKLYLFEQLKDAIEAKRIYIVS
ncbi:hypothetical protein [Lysinibacillus sp. NPDC047702]|uniref:hypothetical protein n=1 Tax=unclassified Lysinibacillus TaxID=2636778 RepID=UPI003CFE5F8E